MKHAVTFLWFGNTPSPTLPHRYAIELVDAPTAGEALRKLPEQLGLPRDEEVEFSVLSVIALDPRGSSVRHHGAYIQGQPDWWVTADEKKYMWTDDIGAASVAVPVARRGANSYLVTGEVIDDNVRFIQAVKGPSVEDAVASVLTWFEEDHKIGDEDVRVWSVVEDRPDGVSVYGPKGSAKALANWTRGEYEEVSGGPSTGAPHPPGLLEKVNRDRARRGQAPLAPGEWSTPDLEEFARHLRNPALQGLKRRLMR